jgi:adenosylcobinamide-phosphate synthase
MFMTSWVLSLPAIALIALLFDATIGYPQRLYTLIGHPVTWIGKLITTWEHRFHSQGGGNAPAFASGCLLLFLLSTLSIMAGLVLRRAFIILPFGFLAEALAVSTLIASRSLATHVGAVAYALRQGLDAGREAVSHIVGRDPAHLDTQGVSRAAIESLAENYSDGVIAPLFWYLVAGLPGILLYKAVNTADSMIGHRNERHEYFGKAAARLDDLLNLIPARLTGLFIVLAAGMRGQARQSFRAMKRDARLHLSPNAGWPEAAMAGALGLKLGGHRFYGSTRTEGAWLGDGTEEATASHIDGALRLFRLSFVLLGTLLLAASIFIEVA